MKQSKKESTLKVSCACGSQSIKTSEYYTPGGFKCSKCGNKVSVDPTNKPDTHKSSRERHGNKTSNNAPKKEKTKQQVKVK